MSHSHLDLLRHIQDETGFLIKESFEMTEEQFLSDEKTKRAFARSIEIIGEAAKRLPEDFRRENNQIDWKPIMRMREKKTYS